MALRQSESGQEIEGVTQCHQAAARNEVKDDSDNDAAAQQGKTSCYF